MRTYTWILSCIDNTRGSIIINKCKNNGRKKNLKVTYYLKVIGVLHQWVIFFLHVWMINLSHSHLFFLQRLSLQILLFFFIRSRASFDHLPRNSFLKLSLLFYLKKKNCISAWLLNDLSRLKIVSLSSSFKIFFFFTFYHVLSSFYK